MENLIELDAVDKAFLRNDQVTWVLRETSLSIRRGEFVAIVGPSGCGKSTLLNLVAGLLAPTRGEVRYGGRKVDSTNTSVGYMTQRDDLLPWRTLQKNLALPLEIAKAPRDERRRRVGEMVELLGLTGFAKHYPAQLSGGMRKRVSLGKTLLSEPDTLLLDEPFSALDAQLRLLLQAELVDLINRFDITTVFVTHDLLEAVALADRVIVMTSRPAQIKAISDVPLAHPRDVTKVSSDPVFKAVHEQLWAELVTEIRAGGEV